MSWYRIIWCIVCLLCVGCGTKGEIIAIGDSVSISTSYPYKMAHIAGADEARSYQDDNKTKATIAIKHHQSQWSEAQKTQYMANIGLWNYRVTERSKETQACVGSYQTYQATFIGDPVSEELLYMVYIFLDIGEKTTTISHISSDKSIHKNMLRDWVTSTKCKKT